MAFVKERIIDFLQRFALPAAPPWLVSLLVHLVLVIVLALIYLPQVIDSAFVLEVTYADELGEQLLDDTPITSNLEPLDVAPALAFDLNPADDPLASPVAMEIKLDVFDAAAEMQTPTIGLALSGRTQGAKRALLAAYGGTGETENAVELALEWLKRNQQREGTWSLAGPYSNGVIGTENVLAATSMALLALQGAGNTHLSGDYADVVKKGKDALLRMQDLEGSFFARQSLQNQHQLYSQGQATMAICELFGMTKDETLREPAQRALNYAISIQADSGNGGGGWRYNPGDGVDTSVTGWFVMGLESGRMAQLIVPSPPREKISRFLDSVTTDGIRYGYRPGEADRIAMTAEALLCRQYLGWSHHDARLIAGMELINQNPIDWDPPSVTETPSVYYWYYATQVAHHMGGEHWEKWNKTMRTALPRAQIKTGRERGSWSPSGDRYGSQGGRLYVTCFCVYMLEVYYRHLPLYQ